MKNIFKKSKPQSRLPFSAALLTDLVKQERLISVLLAPEVKDCYSAKEKLSGRYQKRQWLKN